MNGKKYLVVPGWVTSLNDGQRHFISAGKLMELYKVNPRDCLIAPAEGADKTELIRLYPRADGNYSIK